jgi:hypothetical protein
MTLRRPLAAVPRHPPLAWSPSTEPPEMSCHAIVAAKIAARDQVPSKPHC